MNHLDIVVENLEIREGMNHKEIEAQKKYHVWEFKSSFFQTSYGKVHSII